MDRTKKRPMMIDLVKELFILEDDKTMLYRKLEDIKYQADRMRWILENKICCKRPCFSTRDSEDELEDREIRDDHEQHLENSYDNLGIGLPQRSTASDIREVLVLLISHDLTFSALVCLPFCKRYRHLVSMYEYI